MARKRQRMRRDPHTFQDGMNQGHHNSPHVVDGKVVNVRRISPSDEGVLYTMAISPKRPKPSTRSKCVSRLWCSKKTSASGPETNTLQGLPSQRLGAKNAQFTITKKKKFKNPVLNWFDSHDLNPYAHHRDPDSHLYHPSNFLYRYIDWTFHASFTGVFITFLVYYFVITLTFALLLLVAGKHQPECITSGGEHFGANPYTLFNDAYELSWTTFTTVGYGNGYTSTANDLVAADGTTKAQECSGVVFLCNAEAFLGLLYAGMCGAILFGKVNRVQSHAKLIFANAVCLQYEEIEEEAYDDTETDRSIHKRNGLLNVGTQDGMTVMVAPMISPQSADPSTPKESDYSENQDAEVDEEVPQTLAEQFVEQYNGCPVLKFQVVNEMCNREGSEIVDAIMKVVGVKLKGQDGQVTHSQYVRVNLVDFEHPFFSRVWHGVHILDSTSPLLTEKAKRRINKNNGSWPTSWFDPEKIKEQLEFNDLIVTVLGISNVSAVTVHGYKRYKIGDVLIGFNFAPLVFRGDKTGTLEVDMSLCHDVREQRGGGSEDLQDPRKNLQRIKSTIRISKSKDSDFLDSIESGDMLSPSGRSSGMATGSSSNGGVVF